MARIESQTRTLANARGTHERTRQVSHTKSYTDIGTLRKKRKQERQNRKNNRKKK